MYVYNKNLICYRICFSTSFILDLYYILVYLCFYDLIFSIVLRFIFIIILFCEFNLTTLLTMLSSSLFPRLLLYHKIWEQRETV